MKTTVLITRTILCITLFSVAFRVQAQSYAPFEFSFGWYIQYLENQTELRDGNLLTCTRLFNVDSTGYYTSEYGYCFLKLNREDASIMDSVFLPADHEVLNMMEPHPSGDGYLFVNQKHDTVTQSNSLRIRHFDEDLVFHEEAEIIVPLADSVNDGWNYFALEEDSFVMMGVTQDGSHVFQRFNFDGILLDRTVYPDSVCSFSESRGIKIWNDSPREYVISGYQLTTRTCSFFVLDSLLNLKETITMGNPPQTNVVFVQNAENKVESLDKDTYLMATSYRKQSKQGILVMKRDKATHTNLKTVYFPSKQVGSAVSPYVVDVKQTEEGYIYLAYGDSFGGADKFSVALMDSDMNVLWQIYYTLLYGDFAYKMRLLSDGGIGIIGFNFHVPRVFAFLVSNDYDALEEQGIIVRPYAYYPNPAQDELHLQYSPDVKPTQIELYDLQGRMVRSQRNGLESINLEGLASGTYTMRVTLENGKVFSDKVVKE